MPDGVETEGQMTNESPELDGRAPAGGDSNPTGNQEPTFTQADMDALASKVRGEEKAKAKSKYQDYDDLKKKAGQSKTLEDRLIELEKQNTNALQRAARSDIAAKYGISAEDRDLFLTGVDSDALEEQAKRLAERATDKRANGNYVPREGASTNSGGTGDAKKQFVRDLFGTG